MKQSIQFVQLIFAVAFLLFISGGCELSSSKDGKTAALQTIVKSNGDTHSYADLKEISTKHLHLELDVNFANNTIYGVARHQMRKHHADSAIFDIKYIDIQRVTVGKDKEREANYVIGQLDSIKGAPLVVSIDSTVEYINIYYNTTDKTEALDWMSPELTEGKKHPFLYSQGQTVLTRTWIPLQDTPANRFTYSADVKVPKELMAVMSAENSQERNDSGMYHFEMSQPIPAYLIAIAVGNLSYKSLGKNCGVYAEPEMIDSAANEFVDLPKMLHAAENLYGTYQWKQYDIIVMPKAFPFGGMENPCLTFANPTIITGDKSLVNVIAHELAHSWSGNLVTNASWDDFWLNEGFTVYFENRIMEELYGKEEAEMLAVIEFQELQRTLKNMEPRDQSLKLDLMDRNPDLGMSDVAYIKGAYFLRTLEQVVGRKKFDKFLKQYFKDYAFHTLTTEDFIDYLENNLLEPNHISFNVQEWIYKEGIPDNCIQISSKRLENASALADAVVKNKQVLRTRKIMRSDLSTQEWLAFIRQLPDYTDPKIMYAIDQQLEFKNCGNSEIMCEWYVLAINSGYTLVRKDMEKFLSETGRLKYIEPIYLQLVNSRFDSDHQFATKVFSKAKNGYHPIAKQSVAEILTINA